MAQFTNQARLTYGNSVANSNIAVGEIVNVLAATKTAVRQTYNQGSTITYIINLINSGNTPLTNITVNDNLGEYAFGIGTLVPLDYTLGTLLYFINGIVQPTPSIDTTDGLTITGLSIPANGAALLVYETEVNQFAPINEGGIITNQVIVTSDCGTIRAEETISATLEPQITITKSISPIPVSCGDTVTYTFLIQNSGTVPLVATDNAIVTDTFNPSISNVTATLNGVPIAFDYNQVSGDFSTQAGAITVAAATISQDLTTGEWNITPGSSTLVVTGTI